MKTSFSSSETYVVRGGVEHGDERGRTLGFPTANLSIAGTMLDDGVWTGWVDRGTSRHLAAISVGGRPTFYGRAGFRLLEAHILDFNDDLYDEVITVWLCHRLRGQRRFPSLESLVEQLHADVASCRTWHQAAAFHPPASSITDIPVGVALQMSA